SNGTYPILPTTIPAIRPIISFGSKPIFFIFSTSLNFVILYLAFVSIRIYTIILSFNQHFLPKTR
ncbi:hypothetical protein V6948_08785, partial [Fusobacterium varium]